MELSNQEIRFNLLISNINQLKDQFNDLQRVISDTNKPKSGKSGTEQMGEDADKAKEKFKALQSQINETKREIDKMTQGFDSKKFLNLDEAKRDLRDLTGQMTQLQRTYNSNAYNKYIDAQKKAALELNELDRKRDMLSYQYEARQQKLADLEKRRADGAKVASYESQLSQIRQRGMGSFMSGDTAGFKTAKTDFDALNSKMVEFNKQWGIFNRGFFSTGQTVDYFFAKLRSHASWMATGLVMGSLLTIPDQMLDAAKQTEVWNQKIRQNLELVEKYHGNGETLNKDLENIRNAAALMAVAYGKPLSEVQEAQQIISRRFKDPDAINYFTNLAMTMSKLDFVPTTKAAQDLEAVILQFGLSSRDASTFVDQFSVAVHNYRITGTELLDALERSGSAFRSVNMGTQESIALISTLSTVTARAGRDVGNSWKSILTNMDMPKMKTAMEYLSIKMYDEAGKMRQGIDVWRDIFDKYKNMTEQKQNEFALILSGGKFQANMTKAITAAADTFEEAYQRIGTANSRLTALLLAEGLDTYATRTEQASAAWGVFSSKLAYEALPALKDIALGLTNGIQWMSKHTEEIAFAITALVRFTEAMVMFKAAQFAVSVKFAEMILSLAGYTSASYAAAGATSFLKNNIYDVVSALGVAIGKFAIFMAIAQGLSYMVGSVMDMNDREKVYNEEIAKTGGIRGLKGETTKSEYAQLYEKYTALKDSISNDFDPTGSGVTIDNRQQDIKNMETKLDSIRAKMTIAKTIEEIGTQIKDPNIPGTNRESGTGTDQLGKTKGGGGGGSRDPYSVDKSAIHRDMNDAFSAAKLSADRYQESLDNISFKEKLYGSTVALTVESIDTKVARQKELSEEQTKYNSLAEAYKKSAQEMIDKDTDLTSAMMEYGLTVKDLSKEEYRTLTKDNNYLNKLLDAYNKLAEAASKAGVEVKKLSHDITLSEQGKMNDPDYTRGRRIAGEESQNKWYLSQLDKGNVGYARNSQVIALKEATMKYQEYSVALKNAENDLKNLSTEQKAMPGILDAAQLKVEQLRNSTSDAYTKMKDAAYQYSLASKQFMADTFVDLAVEGKTFEDIMKSIWKQIAKEAIYAMMGIQQQGQMLQAIMGMGKKGKSGLGTSCFPADTEISIPTGKEVIQNIKVGDIVWSFDKNKNIISSTVSEVMKRISNHTYKIITSSGEVVSTAEHPFYTKRGWVKVIDLKLSDILYDIDFMPCEIIDIFRSDIETTVYNLTVENTHTYFANGFAVHNKLGMSSYGSGGIRNHTGTSVSPISNVSSNALSIFPKMHSGGVVPYLKNDETIRTLQSGEEVNSRTERRTIEMLTETMKVMSANQGSSQIVIHAMDSKSFIEFADSHGDALVNIIRKQGSMGNKL